MQPDLCSRAELYTLEPHVSTKDTLQEFTLLNSKDFLTPGTANKHGRRNYYITANNCTAIFCERGHYKVLIDTEDFPKIKEYYWKVFAGSQHLPERVFTNSLGLYGMGMAHILVGKIRRRLLWANGNHLDLRKTNLLDQDQLQNITQSGIEYSLNKQELQEGLAKPKKYPQDGLFTSSGYINPQGEISYEGLNINRFRGKITIKKKVIDSTKNEPCYYVVCPKHHRQLVTHSDLTQSIYHCLQCHKTYDIKPLPTFKEKIKGQDIAPVKLNPKRLEQEEVIEHIRQLVTPTSQLPLTKLDDPDLILRRVITLLAKEHELRVSEVKELLDFLPTSAASELQSEIKAKLWQTAHDYALALEHILKQTGVQ